MLTTLSGNIALGTKLRWTAAGVKSQKVQLLHALATFISKQDEQWLLDTTRQIKLLTLIKSICSRHRNWAPVHFGSPESLGEFLTLVSGVPKAYGTTAAGVDALESVMLVLPTSSQAILTFDFNTLLEGIAVNTPAGTNDRTTVVI